MDNLPELRDIHIPDGVSAFPPAYGWWLILLGAVAAFILAELFIILRRTSKKLYAGKLLKNITSTSPITAAAMMSEVLRRICVYKYPQAAVLSGKEWLNFLNAHSKAKLQGKAAELLVNAPYLPQNTADYTLDDSETLRAFCKEWIGENL